MKVKIKLEINTVVPCMRANVTILNGNTCLKMNLMRYITPEAGGAFGMIQVERMGV